MTKTPEAKTYWCLFKNGKPASLKGIGGEKITLYVRKKDVILWDGSDVRKIKIAEEKRDSQNAGSREAG